MTISTDFPFREIKNKKSASKDYRQATDEYHELLEELWDELDFSDRIEALRLTGREIVIDKDIRAPSVVWQNLTRSEKVDVLRAAGKDVKNL